MCGIAGLIDCQQPADARQVKAMTDAVSYRGPDDEGFAFWGQVTGVDSLPFEKTSPGPGLDAEAGGFLAKGGLVFGHRRLSILDLSAAGRQPMTSCDGRFTVVFNGEIYNYVELAQELSGRGYRFYSHCDTEVLIAAYREWGPDCLHRFNGMWGFALFDATERVLFASRDRFGVKPFYYAADGSRFAFGSEIKQLWRCGFGRGRANRRQVAQFLLYNRSSSQRETMFEGIAQLLPGESLRWKLDGGPSALTMDRWYKPSYCADMHADGKLEGYREKFSELLRDSVRLRLRSDVPVGTCLSGGLDSSSIVITASEILRANGGNYHQKSFTSCFEDRRFDEWNFAEPVVKATGVDAQRVFPDMDRLWEETGDLVWHQEEPFGSTSVYAQWNVMRLASENGVKVLLDGQGADEVMAGYFYYIPDYLISLVKSGCGFEAGRAVMNLRHTGMWNAAASHLGVSFDQFILKAGRRLLGVTSNRSDRLAGAVRSEFLSPQEDPAPANLQSHLYWSVFKSLQPLLRFEDRNSMAFSIEARTPFLDYRLVELFFGMCGAYKIWEGWTKPFIRHAMRGVMPEEVRLRVNKKGFVTPEQPWYRKYRSKIRDMLLESGSPVQIWMNQEKIAGLFEPAKSETREDYSLWRALCVHLWAVKFGLS